MSYLKLLYSNKPKNIGILLLAGIVFGGCNIFDSLDQQDQGVINTIDDGEIAGDDTSKIIVWGMFEEKTNVDPLFDRFEADIKSRDSVTVNVEYTKKDPDTYSSDLDKVLGDNDPNTTPDVFMIHSSWIEKYRSNITNVPNNLIAQSFITNNFHQFLAQDLVTDGQIIGVPLWVDVFALVYNKKFLLDTGATSVSTDWNQFMIQAQNMTKYDENKNIIRAGFSSGVANNVEFGVETLDLLFLQTRTKPLEPAVLDVPFKDDELSKAKEVLNWYKSFNSGEKKLWDNTKKLDTALFIEGKLASIVLPGWRILDILNYKQEYNLDLDFGVSQIPQLNPDSEDIVTYPTYWIFVVSSDSQNALNSHKLLEFITREDEQEFFHKTVVDNGRDFSLLSPHKSVALSQSDSNEYLKPYYESMQYGLRWNMPDGEQVYDEYTKLLNGEITLEGLVESVKRFNNEEE